MHDTHTVCRLVLLTVAGQSFALHLDAVDRVVRMVEVTPLPGAPEAVEGVVDVHGEVIPVVSIRRRLGLASRALAVSDSLMLVQTRHRRIAVIAESVPGVVERPTADFVSSRDIAYGSRQIEGVLKTDDGLVLIQDVDRFFSPEEAQSLDLALARS